MYAGQTIRWLMPSATLEYVWMRMTSRNCLTKASSKSCSVMPCVFSHAMHYGVPRTESNDPRVTQEHEKAEGEIIMHARMLAEMKNHQNLADSQWVVTKHGNQAIWLVMDWLRWRKDDKCTLDQYLKHHVPDAKCHVYAAHQKNFMLRRNEGFVCECTEGSRCSRKTLSVCVGKCTCFW